MNTKNTLGKVFYHQPKYDSMPETPDMGYYLEAWGVHSPHFDHSVYLEKTRGKVHRSSDPRLRPRWPNYKLSLTSYPLGVKWTFNLHPRHLEASFDYAWIEDRNGRRQKTHADAAQWVPDTLTVILDQTRKRRRDYVRNREWERVDPPRDPGPYYNSYGDPEGIESHVPGMYFKAWQPASDRAHNLILEVYATADDTRLRQYSLRMVHDSRFGIDVDDAYAFDILTQDVENELFRESWDNPQPPCPVCHKPLLTAHSHDAITITPSSNGTA